MYIAGKTYEEKKNSLRDMAINFQVMAGETGLSWGELLYFQNLFEKYGKRYGLLKEFRENLIC